MTSVGFNGRASLKLIADGADGGLRDLELLCCVGASGLMGSLLVLTGLPSSRLARDLLWVILVSLACRAAAIVLKHAFAQRRP